MDSALKSPPSLPRRRRLWPWLAFVVGVVLTAAVLIHVLTRQPALDRLKQQIRSEVPVGSTREQVEAWAKRRLGRGPSVWDAPWPAEVKGRTLPEAAGVPWDDLGSMMAVNIPAIGWYTVNGRAARNELNVFFTLDNAGRVKGCHFLTLEELAAIERSRGDKPSAPVGGAR